MSDKEFDGVLEEVDVERRAALRDILVKTAFAAPVVATFAMGGLSIQQAHAYGSNISPPPPPP